ncbi:MAG: glycoside hydrolase family 1 protein [Candidatus Omnitrophota bacterium]
MIEFPRDFLWGAATSAYQVEGNNIHSDWWEWEKRLGLKETSGAACRHYELYRQDFDAAKSLQHNAHRLSVEWSRIEPEEGKFSLEELRHYQDVILALKERGITPIVTLHHFTNPIWFSRIGGWQNKGAVNFFLRYAQKVAEALGENLRFWVTVNEPMVYIYHAYILGVWPPQKKSLREANIAAENLLCAHIQCYRLIHSLYKKNNWPPPMVSIAKNMQAFRPCIITFRNKLAAYLRNKGFNFSPLEKLIRANALDFIGVNYYSRSLVETKGWGIKNMLLDVCEKNHSQLEKNSLGWDIYPEGFYGLLLDLKAYNLPLFILENGICTADDGLRWEFIRRHLLNLHQAMGQGVKVLGYLYWSLLDNYEWDKGFAPRFGLLEVDYQTFRRKSRESAQKFAEVCKTGRLL